MANEFKVKKGLIVDGSNTVLDIQGTQGQLFSVTDSLTGDLFSVSDISGVPIFNVNSSGAITIDGDIVIGENITYDIGTSTVKLLNVHAQDFHGTFNGHLTGNAGSVSSIGNLTGHITSANRVTSLGSFTTAELNAAISDGSINSQSIPSGNQIIDWTQAGAGTIHTDNYIENVVQTTVTGNAGTVTNGAYINANQTFTGTNQFNSNVTFDTTTVRVNTNVNMDFGDTSMFRLTHTGSSGHMKFTNRLHGAYTYIQSEDANGNIENLIKLGGSGGEVNLSYGGAYKLSTASNGVTVAGAMHATSSIGTNFTSGSSGQQMEPGDASAATLRCDANRWRVYMGANNGETLTVTETGRVGIDDSSPDYPLDVNGNVSSISIYASHDIAAYSDARVKGDIKTIPDALDKVNKLRGVTFVRTDEGASDKRMMGVIAQEVKDIIPEVVTARESDGHYAVSYGNIVGLLIESIKELTAEVESLKKQIDGGTK